MVEAVVEHDYEAREPDELSLKKGDIISNVTIKSGGWWEGTLQRLGKRGMFPDNFVKVVGGVDKKGLDSSQNQSNYNKSVVGCKCKVLFNYNASVEDELDLNIGDIIDVTGEVEEGWWKGKLKNRIGVFPSNFVTVISDNDISTSNDSLKRSKIIDETAKLISEESKDASSMNMSKSKENLTEINDNLPALPPKPSKEMCKVLYGYKAANDDELTLEEGDIITITTKDVPDPGWWKGELRGKVGVFPDNFVKIITPLDEVKPDRPTKVTKSKDSITKSSSSASVYSSSSSIAVSRKFSDSIRPTVLVKPLLPPPPLKKPTLSPVDKQNNRLPAEQSEHTATKPSIIKQQQEQEKQAAAAAKHPITDLPISANRGSMSNSVTSTVTKQSSGSQGGNSNETKWTVIETSSDASDGISWSRQSYSVTSSNREIVNSSSTTTSSTMLTTSNLNSTNSGTAVAENLDLDLVGRSAMLKHPTTSRAKVPKRRLPSSFLSREDSRESDTGETIVNGNVEPPLATPHEKLSNNKQPPWVEELKLNQAKKSQGGGKTRVLISSDTSSASSTSEVSRVALRQVPITTQRPLSLQPGAMHRVLGTDQESSKGDSTITLSLQQWNQLCDKVSRLETELEEQRREFGKTIKELVDTIDQQSQKQKKILSDLEKLTDLVTQV